MKLRTIGPVIGCIGTGDRWRGAIGPQIRKHGDIVAVCDVDKNHCEKWGKQVAGEKADTYEDYRKILDRKDVEIVTVVTPDHWHSKIAIEAMQAGKDVYCEKPLTLTIDEGKKICQVQKKTGRVFQVGTQQRDEFSATYRPTARASDSRRWPIKRPNRNQIKRMTRDKPLVSRMTGPSRLCSDHNSRRPRLARSGKLGKIKQITCSIGGVAPCPPLNKVPVPAELNWEMWQGQTPLVDYVQGGPSPSNAKYPAGRTHYEFRWWYEYSGGKLTDWGAHHVDIAQWAMGMDHSGPTGVEAVAELPVPFEKGHPTIDNQYNTAKNFNIAFTYPNGVILIVRDGPSNGLWIEGDKAEIFVSRDRLMDVTGNVIAELSEKPLAEETLLGLWKGKKLTGWPDSHMANFIECVRDRSEPISDVHSHHRSMTTCHLANIAIRLNRPLRWDADKEEFVGDADANTWLAREQRKGYEIKV